MGAHRAPGSFRGLTRFSAYTLFLGALAGTLTVGARAGPVSFCLLVGPFSLLDPFPPNGLPCLDVMVCAWSCLACYAVVGSCPWEASTSLNRRGRGEGGDESVD